MNEKEFLELKAGDKIKIVELKKLKKCRLRDSEGKMDCYAGEWLTVREWFHDYKIGSGVFVEENGFVWGNEMIETAEKKDSEPEFEYMSEEEFKSLKSGDIVTIREWADMEAQFGLDEDGDIPDVNFVRKMQYLCGKKTFITKYDEAVVVCIYKHKWFLTKEMLLPGHKSVIGCENMADERKELYEFRALGLTPRQIRAILKEAELMQGYIEFLKSL